jgi:hypothetical protein
MLNNFVITKRHQISFIKAAFAAVVALSFAGACTSTTAYAKKKHKAHYGQIEIATTPNGFPLHIDGKDSGETSTTVRVIQLDPGHHTLELILPNGGRWVRDFNIEEGRKVCVNLNYHPRTITITKSPCPYPINVSAPPSVNDGDLITFTSDISYGGSSTLNYAWTVTPAEARIVSGAGTSTITVDSTGLGGKRVTATLVVDDGSGDAMCRQRSQASTIIVAPPPPPVIPPRKFDEFPSVAFDDDKARFDNFAIELQNEPTAQGYIIIYAGRKSRTGQADRLSDRTRDYLANARGVDPSRLIIINGGYREQDMFELWIVPQGAQPPQPSPTVQPGETQPTPDTTKPRRPRRGGD